MPIEIMIPRLGWSMDEGVFVCWLKGDGDPVRAGDPLFTLQGEKATQDIEAIDDGTLQIPISGPLNGATVAVGAVIGHLLQPGDSDQVVPSTAKTAAPIAAIQSSHSPLPTAARVNGPRSSPLARRIAREHGIDWTQLVGSGSSGRIRRVDVLDAVQIKANRTRRSPANPNTTNQPERSILVSQTRRTIAGRMAESRRSTAPVTLTTTVDMTNLVGLRQQFKAAEGPRFVVPSFLDFTVKLTSLALLDHPLLNARWSDGADQIVIPDQVNIGIAVDTDAGLLVPVIHDTAQIRLREITAISRDLVDRARGQQLRQNDLHGGTFTITNLGAFGIETFTPIINPPECAILGMGKIERRPVMDGDKVVGRDLMNLSLTFDHRIVDGAPAARFLQQLTQYLENPAPWLVA